MSRPPLAIDLFAGLGGWTEGLLDAGYFVVGFDIERHEYDGERYPANLVLQDVLTIHGSQFKDAALIVASPPCQAYSYMAMPWSRAKAKAAAIRADETGEALKRLNALFDACFRIQREACEAAGRHIPMVVENVRGAQPWVGRARWNFGSYYLWGDVPALMPATAAATKVPGFRFDGSGVSFQTAAVEGMKNGSGGSWFGLNPDGSPGAMNNARDGVKNPGRSLDRGSAKFNDRIANFPPEVAEGRKHHGDWFRDPACPSRQGGQLKPPARVSKEAPAEGRKSAGSGAEWFDQNISSLPSNSPRRKAASAKIAKIPLTLSRYIARHYLPTPSEAAA